MKQAVPALPWRWPRQTFCARVDIERYLPPIGAGGGAVRVDIERYLPPIGAGGGAVADSLVPSLAQSLSPDHDCTDNNVFAGPTLDASLQLLWVSKRRNFKFLFLLKWRHLKTWHTEHIFDAFLTSSAMLTSTQKIPMKLRSPRPLESKNHLCPCTLSMQNKITRISGNVSLVYLGRRPHKYYCYWRGQRQLCPVHQKSLPATPSIIRPYVTSYAFFF